MNDFEPPPSFLWQILLLVFLLILSMFFSASETAFLSTNKLYIRYLKKQKDKNASRVNKILKLKQNFLATGLIANTLVNNLITVVITTISISLFYGEKAVGYAVAVATVLVLIFGEIVPKAVALSYPDTIALKVSPIISLLIKLFTPVVSVFNVLTKPFLFLLGVRSEDKGSNVTEEDLKTFFEESEKLGQISLYERTMMEKILRYADIQAKHIMTPRPEIQAISSETSLEEILELSKTSHFSRFPVYEKDIDDIIGIFYVKDLLFSSSVLDLAEKEAFDLRKFLREPIFVFEGTNSSKLQDYFHTASQNMLVVLDEYGGTAGIVTTEDLTEAVFGDIEDEYDIKSNQECIKVKDGFIVFGTMQITDFNAKFHSNFSDVNYETVAGLVLEHIGDMPTSGATVQIGEFFFQVLEATPIKIKKLKVKVVS